MSAEFESGNEMVYYRRTIKENPVLDREDERFLLEAAKDGDTSARDRLFKSNLGFVLRMAASFMARYNGGRRCCLRLGDMVAKGFEAFCHAIDKFDLGRNEKLITYASGWLTCFFQNLVDEETGVGRRSPERYSFVSMDADEGGHCLGESMESGFDSPEDAFFRRETREMLGRVMSEKLNGKQAAVVTRRLGLDGLRENTCSEIGAAMGCSKSYVSELYRKALSMLDTPENRDWFMDCLAA